MQKLIPLFVCALVLAATSAFPPGLRAQTPPAVTTLYAFDTTNGGFPLGSLLEGRDGNFYGAANNYGDDRAGTVYRMTPAGIVSTLHDFTDGTDGAIPTAGLVLGSDGNFYGTTLGDSSGGGGDGTLFQITPAGVLTSPAP